MHFVHGGGPHCDPKVNYCFLNNSDNLSFPIHGRLKITYRSWRSRKRKFWSNEADKTRMQGEFNLENLS